jgi:integrase
MFRRAVEWELLEKSPMEGLKFLRENNARTRYLTIEECERLIDACIAPHVRAVVITALHTGMRQSEIFNLRWRDIDFSSSLILVADTKNGEPRHIPMDSTMRTLLSSSPHRTNAEWIFGWWPSAEYSVRLPECCQASWPENLRFHDLRHSMASNWVQSGGDLYNLKSLLGHKTITITQRYAHLSPDKREVVKRMDNIWKHGHQGIGGPSEVTFAGSSVTARSQGAELPAPPRSHIARDTASTKVA